MHDGNVILRRPGLTEAPIDVNVMPSFGWRSPKDCSYATDHMLQALDAPKKKAKQAK